MKPQTARGLLLALVCLLVSGGVFPLGRAGATPPGTLDATSGLPFPLGGSNDTIGGDSIVQAMGQTFTALHSAPVVSAEVDVLLGGSSTGPGLTAQIVGLKSNVPDLTNVLGSGTVTAAAVAASGNDLVIPITSTAALTAGQQYALVLSVAGSAPFANGYLWKFSAQNTTTPPAYIYNGTSWTQEVDGFDGTNFYFYFGIYVDIPPTATAVVANTSPSLLGQGVTYTATVSGSGSVGGTVDFYDNGTGASSCSGTKFSSAVAVDGSGHATSGAVSTLSLGSHTITACYSGTSANGASSGSTTQVVQANTTTTLVANPAAAAVGASVTFTATVAPVSPATGVPSGSASVYDGTGAGCPAPGTPLIGSAQSLNGGNPDTASLATSSLTAGSHTLLACYPGDSTFRASSGTATLLVVSMPTGTLTFPSPTGLNGWFTSTAVGSITARVAADAPSSDTITSISCPGAAVASFTPAASVTAAVSVSSDGTTSLTCSITDSAGVVGASNAVSVKLDRSGPVVTRNPSGDSCSKAGSNGWCAGTQTASFSATDVTSGMSSPCVAAAGVACTFSRTSSTQGSSVSIASGQACDVAGNCVTDTASATFMIDATPPVVTVTGASNGATYTLGNVPAAGCTTTDATSGVATQASVQITGGTANGVGSFTATCSGGTDNAGNVAPPVSVSYTVNYTFSGFLAPVNNPPTVNTGKAGRTYPVKFQLTTAGGGYLSALSAVKSVTFQASACGSFGGNPTNALETEATGSTSLRYDSTANQYVYDWATPAPGCYTLYLTLDSGQVFTAYFNFS